MFLCFGMWEFDAKTTLIQEEPRVFWECADSETQKYPQYCLEFHDRLWEALSGTTSEKRSVRSRTGGGGDTSGNALEPSNDLDFWGLGDPRCTLEGNSRKHSESVSGVFPEFFQHFFRNVPAVLGVWPRDEGNGWQKGGGRWGEVALVGLSHSSFHPSLLACS